MRAIVFKIASHMLEPSRTLGPTLSVPTKPALVYYSYNLAFSLSLFLQIAPYFFYWFYICNFFLGTISISIFKRGLCINIY